MTARTMTGVEIDLPESIERWSVDDNNQRYDFAYRRQQYPAGAVTTSLTDFGLYHLLNNSCSSPFAGNDGQEGRPEINEYVITLHCVEFLYVVEVIRIGSSCSYRVLGMFGRDV